MQGARDGWTAEQRFAARSVAWSLVWFALVRLESVEAHLLLPLTVAQSRLATSVLGAPAMPIEITLACSGADVLGLFLGAVCAYPATWRMRAAGAVGGLALILGLNTLRIGSLGRVAASPVWFDTLHVYVWPAILTLAVGGYVFAWIRMARREHRTQEGPTATTIAARPTRRFVVLAGASIVVFAVLSPLYLQSAGVLAVAEFVARAGAWSLRLLGLEASAVANVLWTSHGGVMVTQECISTPLIPLYLAAVVSYSRTWHGGAVALAAAAPIFVTLGIARLLVIALPATIVASPLWLIHAFYQLLLGAVVVCIAACWRHRDRVTAARRALRGIGLGIACLYVSGPAVSQAFAWIAAPLDDPQGALTFLPAFQVGLYVALWSAAFMGMGWRVFVTGLALLLVTQVASLFALVVLATQFGITTRVPDVRAWAVIGPLLVLLLLQRAVKGRRARGCEHAQSDLVHVQ